MTQRDSFLSRVRLAAEQGRPYRVHLKPFPEGTGYLGVAGDPLERVAGDPLERFAAEVNAVGGEAFVVADLAAAARQLQTLLAEAGATSALVWEHELLDRLGLAGLLHSAGVKVHRHATLAEMPAGERRPTLLACDIGITSCDRAIAETGTLMMCSRPGQERLASLLPPYHVAVVERSQIVPDLIDAIDFLAPTRGVSKGTPPLPSNVTLITGPSKTGDIELQLTTGVHGPGKWRVIVIQ
ncbi:MAG: lactate utilization protein [Pirellulaceae bacterium]|nr:lactate utilization protein [Pirellulaceae bacterium]